MTIFTIGHSTHPEDDFVALSSKEGAPLYKTLLDTRSHPGSKWPQHRKENLEQWLPDRGIGYEWMPSIGGWQHGHEHLAPEMASHGVQIASYLGRGFPKQRIAATEASELQDPAWTNTGLRDYSYFMATEGFLRGADELIARGAVEDVAIMCCEVHWWRCHRSMISDYLAFRGVETFHIMPHVRQKNKVKYVDGAKIIPHSSVLGNRLDRYEQFPRAAWQGHRVEGEAHGDYDPARPTGGCCCGPEAKY